MTPREARLAVDLFTALVVASVGVALAGVTWRLAGDPGQRLGASPVAVRARRPVDLPALLALAPFGDAAPVATAAATDQSLVLRGILLAEPRAASAALISVNGAAPAAFYVGQSVGPGTIESIEMDRVVFAGGSGRQMLAFPDPGGAPAPPPSAGAPPMMAPPAPPPPPSVAPAAPAAPAAPPPGASAATMLAGLGTPTADGIKVVQPAGALAAAGLQPNDTVTAINGTPAADAARDPARVQGAVSSGRVQIEVLRGGRRLTLPVELR